jgi:cell division protease FtsH
VDGATPPKRPAASEPRSGSGSSWLIWIGLGLLAVLLLSNLFESGNRIDYSDLKAKVRGGEVGEVVITGDQVRARAKATEAGKEPVWWISGRGNLEELEKLLDEQKVQYRYEVSSGLWGSLLPWILMLGAMVLFWSFILRRMKPGAGVMSIGKSRAKLVAEETGTTFNDVAGVDEAVDELKEIVEFLATPDRFRRLGGKIPKGVLLVGPPGTGKTLLARAVAGEAKVPFFHLTGSDFVEMFVGVGAARVRDMFREAQAKAPCIIFIDELDAIGKARGIGVMAGHDEREQTLNQLLAEMDGFDARRGLIVMAATNRPEILDPALLRPGRFDRQVVVDRPDLRGREAILQVHAKTAKLAPDVDLRRVAALTPGFAGAELANVVNEGALLAARRRKDAITMQELNEAIERVVAGLEKKNRRMNEREKRIVAHHESGHALLAELLPTTDRVHKVSIIPRGLGALGYTMQVPLEDRYLVQRGELLDRITVLMGGRCAEETMFGEISTGAQDDLQRATDMARRMVTQFGMSEAIGPQSFGQAERESRYLPGVVMPSERVFSEKTAELIDRQIQELLEHCHERALTVIGANRPQLEALAEILLQEEVVEGERLNAIFSGAKLPPEERAPTADASMH